MDEDKPRKLSRQETHDLSMIIKDRTKVLKAYVEEQSAACRADFEAKLAARYQFDADDKWKEAAEAANRVIEESNIKIRARCKEMGIPAEFAPGISIEWRSRGENAVATRRTELRRVATSAIEAMAKAAVTKIEKQSLDLRTQIVAMGLLSPDAKMFLESLAPVDDAMGSLDFGEMEKRLEAQKRKMRQLGYNDT